MAYCSDEQITLYHGDSLEVARALGDGAADCIVTSPPYYGLRDYGIDGQYGLESSPAEYVETMRALFAELRRVLADDGTLWLNIGDSYSIPPGGGHSPNAPSNVARRARGGAQPFANGAQRSWNDRKGVDYGVPPKNLMGIPWRVAFALQDDGWILRNAIIWNKPNAMPENVLDRMASRYEHVFMFSKKRFYWFDTGQIRVEPDKPAPDLQETARNPGDIWTIPTQPFAAAHFAVMPVQLAQRCILAGCKPGGAVLDPFSGSGTTGLAALNTGRRYIGIDLNAEYLDLSLKTRLREQTLIFDEDAG